MDKEIEVGEYVRTKEGYISKCIEVDEDGDYFTFDNYVEVQCGDKFNSLYDYELNKIIKHSKNIIDLIKVGDYVNGSKVIDIAQEKTKAAFIESQDQKFALIPIVEKQIKSIVTKEQFDNMKYKVKE